MVLLAESMYNITLFIEKKMVLLVTSLRAGTLSRAPSLDG